MATLLSNDIVTGRKDHRCDWCGEKIDRGTKHRTWTYPDEGRMMRIRAHLGCAAAWDREALADGGWYETHPVNEREPDPD